MIGYWQDQTGSIDASFFQFTIQTHFAIATFRCHPRDLPALFPGIFFIPGRTYLDKEFTMNQGRNQRFKLILQLPHLGA